MPKAVHMPKSPNRESNLWKLKERIARHCFGLFPDQSFNPKFWNEFFIPDSDGCISVRIQRYCNGRRRGILNTIEVRRKETAALLRKNDLQKLSDHLMHLKTKQLR